MTRPLTRQFRYLLETIAVYLIYGIFKLLPLTIASNCGAFIIGAIGPHLPSRHTADKNLRLALPEKTAAERKAIIKGMWQNLGHIMGEYPHLHDIWSRVDFVGREYIQSVIDNKKPAIFFGGHLANWEVNAIATKKQGLDIHLIYRRPNNPWVDSLLRHARNSGASGHIAKGAEGAREMMHVLKKGGTLGILMDQKLNEGMAIPFFGHDAMTAPAIAHFALKYGCPIFPSRMERLPNAHFKMTIYPPLVIPDTGNKDEDTRLILTKINEYLETWIRERPEQWLWIHRRWPE